MQFKEQFIEEEVVNGKGQKEGLWGTFCFLISLLGDKFMICVYFSVMYTAVTFKNELCLLNNMKDFTF